MTNSNESPSDLELLIRDELKRRGIAADEETVDWFQTQARASQQEPPGDWRYWLLLAGRGFGKTRTIVEWGKKQAHEMPGSRGMIVASTVADARDVLIEC